jgi:hypothetical protein
VIPRPDHILRYESQTALMGYKSPTRHGPVRGFSATAGVVTTLRGGRKGYGAVVLWQQIFTS